MVQERAIDLKRKLEKVFGRMSELDNNLDVELELFNMANFATQLREKSNYPISIFAEQCKIRAIVKLDPLFYDLLQELTRQVAPKFAESPIMAVLPMLGDLNAAFE